MSVWTKISVERVEADLLSHADNLIRFLDVVEFDGLFIRHDLACRVRVSQRLPSTAVDGPTGINELHLRRVHLLTLGNLLLNIRDLSSASVLGGVRQTCPLVVHVQSRSVLLRW